MLDRFPFNVDKFLQLSLHSQQTHLSDWLEDCYHKQIQGKFTELELELLFEQYIQFFLGQKNLKKPKTTAEWKEFFSQRFHYHRNKTNQGIKENNFLPSNQKVLVIGECEIQIFGETKPCYRMDEAMDGLEKQDYYFSRHSFFCR